MVFNGLKAHGTASVCLLQNSINRLDLHVNWLKYLYLFVCSHSKELLRIMKSSYLKELVDVEIDGRHLQPAKSLSWLVLTCVKDIV